MSDTALLRPLNTDTGRIPRAQGEFPVEADANAGTTTPRAVSVRQWAKQLPSAPAKVRESLRKEIVQAITKPVGGSPSEFISAALSGFLESNAPGHLDEAVDVLGQTGSELLRYIQDENRFNPPEKGDPDYWYVLFRALGQLGRTQETEFLLECALITGRRPLMEAAISVLGERGDGASIARLRRIAGENHSTFIQELVEEALEDCED